jgi:cobalt/nickel transport system permease protein
MRRACVLVLALCALPDRAEAMHITEGILPAGWAGVWYLVAIPFVVWGLRDLRVQSARAPVLKPMVGLVGAAVFVLSCMPIPVPVVGTCSHAAGTGLAAILIGPALTAVVASIALLLQALFLAHGGLTTLGANVVSMGIVGGLTGYAVFHAARRLGLPLPAAAFLAGLLSDWATYAATAFELAAALRGSGSLGAMFGAIALAFLPTQLPLGILEGVVTAGVYRFIRIRRPSLLECLRVDAAAGCRRG